MPQPFPVVLAAGGEGLVLLVVLVVSLISWVWNLVQGNKPKPKPGGGRPRPASQEQSELERFLQEVVGNKPAPAPAAAPEKKRPAPKPRAESEKKNKPKQKPQTQTQAPSKPATSDRPGARLAQSHLTTLAAGDGVRSHVANQLDSRNVDAAVKRDIDVAVRRDINDAVQRDLGVSTTTSASQQPVHPMILALRNPEGVRQAIIMTEILGRPKSMR